MAVKPSKILIVNEYIDLATVKIKKGFAESERSVDQFSLAMKKMQRSTTRSSDKMRKDMVGALEKIGKSTRRVTNEQQRMRIATENLRRHIGALRNNLLLVFFAYRLIIKPMKEWVALSERQEIATRRLNFSLEAQGTLTERSSKRLNDMANEFQRTTRFGNELVQEVMQQLIDIGGVMPSQMKKATQAVLDFSTKTGRSVESAALQFAKAMTGYTGELSKLGIQIDANLSPMEKSKKVLEEFEKRFGGAAQDELQNFSGVLDQTKNSFSDLAESMGKVIVKELSLKQIFRGLGENAENMNKSLKGENVPTEIDRISGKIKTLDAAIVQVNRHIDSAAGKGFGDFGERQADKYKEVLGQYLEQRKALESEISEERNIVSREDNIGRMKDRIDELAEFRIKSQDNFRKESEAMDAKDARSTLKQLEKRMIDFRMHVTNKIALEEWYAKKKREIELRITAQDNAEMKNRIRLKKEYALASQRALQDGFFNVITGQFKKLTDVVRNFGQDLLRVASSKLAEQTLIRIGLGGILGLHTGGPVRSGMSTSSGYERAVPRKKFHVGGEVNATLLGGEGVVNRRGMEGLGVSNLNKLNRGEGLGGGVTNITNNIYTIDERSFRDRLKQEGDIFESAVITGISSNREVRRTIQRHT